MDDASERLGAEPTPTSTSPRDWGLPSTRPTADDDLPPDVLALLREHVRGLDDLRVLLLVHDDASRRWTPAALAGRLALPEARTASSLESLRAAALLVEDGSEAERRFSYRPARPDIAATVTRLARLHDERPADVIRRLNENAIERVRAAASLAFPEVLVPRTKND